MSRPELTIDCDANELNMGKEKKKKLNDTLAMVSNITALYSRKIDKKNSKSGIRRQYDSCGVYMNRTVNDGAHMIKVDDSDISDELISNKEFLVRMLERLDCNSMPCPCGQLTLSRSLRNDSKSNENSVIFVPQLEVYKFYEIQNMNNSGTEQDIPHDRESVIDRDELTLQEEREETNVNEQHLFTNANAIESVEEQEKEKEKLKHGAKFVAQKLLDSELISKENDFKIKQCGGQMDSKRVEKIEWHGRKNIEQDSDNLGKTISKNWKEWCILSRFQKKCNRRKLPRLISSDFNNSFSTERNSAIFRRPLNRGNSLSVRHCGRTQRMEKRATKTLGIVVGIFLACWVPFFSVYILSAVCIQIDIKSCQVDFYAFFYTTWLGYINSCINPIIYTIFNVEFRRAFKRILFGKVSVRKNI